MSIDTTIWENDYLCWDGTETAQIVHRQPGADVTKEGVIVKRADKSEARGAFSDVLLGNFDLLFFVPVMLLDLPLKEGDRIVVPNGQGTESWKITRATHVQFGNQWVAGCVRERT